MSVSGMLLLNAIAVFPSRKVKEDGDIIASNHIEARVLNHRILMALPRVDRELTPMWDPV